MSLESAGRIRECSCCGHVALRKSYMQLTSIFAVNIRIHARCERAPNAREHAFLYGGGVAHFGVLAIKTAF